MRRDDIMKKAEVRYFVVKGLSSEAVIAWALGCEALRALMIHLEDG